MATEGWQPNEAYQYRALWLKERYEEDVGWTDILESAQQTSEAVRRLAEAIVSEADRVDSDHLTALYRLCQHAGQTVVERKARAVWALDIPRSEKRRVLEVVDERNGSVGGTNFPVEVPDERAERRFHELFSSLLDSSSRDELDQTVEEFVQEEVKGVQSGLLSPILHYLYPETFPIINRHVVGGVEKYFHESFSRDLGEYPEYYRTYRGIRDRFGFEEHFRHLDYFFVWAEQMDDQWDHPWTWAVRDDGSVSRDVWAVQPGDSDGDDRPLLWPRWREGGIVTVGGADGDLRFLTDDQLETLGDDHDWGAERAWKAFKAMSPGDVVVAKWGQKEMVGIGVVRPRSYEYDEDGPTCFTKDGQTVTHPHVRHVDWIFTKEGDERLQAVESDSYFLPRVTAKAFDEKFDEFRYRFAGDDHHRVAAFERAERTSELYSGGTPTAFDLATDGQGDDGDPLRVPPREDHDVPADALFEGLYFPDEGALRDQIRAAIRSGKHVVFTGPPGTGKTELAENAAEQLAREYDRFTGYQLTTATADWTTFDTVGGRMPADENDALEFSPGIVLECFKHGGSQQNELLIVDELNRADIDKAFGQLFTVLSGQGVTLPFEDGDEPIEIVPESDLDGRPDRHEYVVPEDWRLFGTMNSYDKTTLYEMSYAFMRRLAFVEVGIPDLGSEAARDDPVSFLAPYLEEWFTVEVDELDADTLDDEDDLPTVDDVEAVTRVWQAMATGQETRPIGPAIVEDMLTLMNNHDGDVEDRLADAIVSYVLPQLEGLPDRGTIVENLIELDTLSGSEQRVASTAETMLDETIDTSTE